MKASSATVHCKIRQKYYQEKDLVLPMVILTMYRTRNSKQFVIPGKQIFQSLIPCWIEYQWQFVFSWFWRDFPGSTGQAPSLLLPFHIGFMTITDRIRTSANQHQNIPTTPFRA